MKIHYSSNRQQKTLTDMRLLKKEYGKDHEKIGFRLSELRAAECLNDIPEVPPPRRHKLSGEYAGCWGLDYSRNGRIIIKPAGEYDINDLKSIIEVAIVDLRDYH